MQKASTLAQVSRVYKAEDGSPHLVVLASGPKLDKSTPRPERMTEKSLDNMVRESKAGDIRLTPAHNVPLTLGKSVDASRDSVGNVLIDFAMKADSPLAMEVYGEFERGEWADRQVSIGGAANHVPVMDATTKAMVTELDDMHSNHACLTYPGKAFYPDAGVMSAVMKAVDDGDAEALRAQGLTEDEVKDTLAEKAKKGAPMLDVAKAQAALIEKAAKLGVKLEPLSVEKGASFSPDTWAWPASKKVGDCLNALYILSLLQDLCMSEGYESTLDPEDKAQVTSLMACCSSVEDFIAAEIKEGLEPGNALVAMAEEPKAAEAPDAVAKAEPGPEPIPELVTKAEFAEVAKAVEELKGTLTRSREEVEALKLKNASLEADVAKALAVPVEPGHPVFKDENGNPTTVNPEAKAGGVTLDFTTVQKAYIESADISEFQHKITRLTAEAGVNAALRGK